MSREEQVKALPPGDLRQSWGLSSLSLGISLGGPSNHDEWHSMLEWAEQADRLGLHSVWIPEMHFAPGGATSPILNLVAIAARTRRLRLATTSLLLPIHHPLQIAEEVATLDHLSGGRVILGLGRGFRPALFSAFGIDPSSKRDRFDESLDVILDSWTGGSPDLRDTHFPTIHHPAPGGTIPFQRPHPPLAVAAFGRKGLAQSARRGLPYLASPMEPLDLIEENLDFHRDTLPPEVDASDLPVPIMRSVFVTEDPALASRVTSRLGSEGRIPTAIKLPAAIARALSAPLADRVIVGGVAEVIDRLSDYRSRLGMNLLIVRAQVAGASKSEREQSLVRLAEEVLPAVG